MNFQLAVGQTIYRYRHEAGLSQLRLAELAGVHLNTVQSLESGRYQVKLITLFQLARALNVTVEVLIRDVEKKNPDIPIEFER